MQDRHFPPDQIDEQTEPAAGALAPEDARLVSELHAAYAPLAEANSRSLQEVRARLASHQEHLPRAAGTGRAPLPFPARPAAQGEAMKRALRFGMWPRDFAVVAAVLVLTLLVGSMALWFTAARQGKPDTSRGNQASASATATPWFHQFPAPTPAPGVYLISQVSWENDQVSKVDPQTKQALWSKQIGYMESPLVIYGDTVYFTAGEGNQDTLNNVIYALNAETGAVRWRDDLGDETYTYHIPGPLPPNSNLPPVLSYPGFGMLNTPVLSDGLLFVGARNGKFYAFDAGTGAQRWMYQAQAQAAYQGEYLDDPTLVVSAGVVYGAIHNTLFGVDEATGKERWSVSLDGLQVFHTLVVADGVLYAQAYVNTNFNTDIGPQHYLYAYGSDGAQRWRLDLGQGYFFSSFVFDQGVFYYGSYDGNLYARRASDGKELWRFQAGGAIFDSPILSGGMIFLNRAIETANANRTAFTSRSTIMAVSLASHALVWQQLVPYSNASISLEAAQGGVVYVGAVPGLLYAYNASNGALLWKQHFGAVLKDKTGEESEFAPVITIID